jgi:transposase InsO family protein
VGYTGLGGVSQVRRDSPSAPSSKYHLHPSGGGVRLSGGGHGRLLQESRRLGARRSSAGSPPLEALDKAIASRGGSLKDLIHHSDRGVQYACRDYALRLSQIGAHASMSRPGTPQDNAPVTRLSSTSDRPDKTTPSA